MDTSSRSEANFPLAGYFGERIFFLKPGKEFLEVIRATGSWQFPHLDQPAFGFHEPPHPYPYVGETSAPAPIVNALLPAPAYPFDFPYFPYSWVGNSLFFFSS